MSTFAAPVYVRTRSTKRPSCAADSAAGPSPPIGSSRPLPEEVMPGTVP